MMIIENGTAPRVDADAFHGATNNLRNVSKITVPRDLSLNPGFFGCDVLRGHGRYIPIRCYVTLCFLRLRGFRDCLHGTTMRIAHGWFLKPFRRGISIFSAGRGYSALNSARVAPCVVLARKGLLGKKGGEGIGRCVGLRFFGKKKKGKKSKGETVEAEQPKKSSKSSKPSPSDDAESELDLDSYKE
eukprot:1093027-Amorphochlora_amoeboformis.AAC.1